MTRLDKPASDIARIVQAAIWLGVAAMLIAQAAGGLRRARRRVARSLAGRWADIEDRAEDRARRAEIAELAAAGARIGRRAGHG
jgi:hypothetical protein